MMENLRRDAWYVGDLAGIPIFLHWTVLFLCFSAWNRSGGTDAGVDVFILMLIALLGSIVLHELGHGLMARRLGAHGLTITLWAFGGLCEARRDHARLGREIAIVAAGPAVSLALFLASWYGFDWLRANSPALVLAPAGFTLLGDFLIVMADLNLLLLIFNMLPIYPLDGGQLTYFGALVITRKPLLARQISLFLAVIGSLMVFAWFTGFFQFMHHPDPVGTWLQALAANPVHTLMLVLLLFILLRSAFLHLY